MQFDIQGDLAFLQAAGVLKSLLADKTTGRHILWGTDAYADRGPDYARDQEIEIALITGENGGLLKTRAQKAAEQQTERTRQHAEVFTPAWICRMMNDQADTEWFGREEVFFRKDGEPTERVDFKKKSWKRYVDSKRLEITCGEAPYLVSRYDVSSGEPIPIARRAGLLDRKLRVVNENTESEADWLKWAFRAYEATYGYEFQGDNLLIARVNLMMTFGEYLKARWQRQPTLKEWKRLARAVVWNIWQMDGLTCALPYAKGHEIAEQTEFLSAFGFEPPQEKGKQPYCRIYLWRYLKASTEFRKIKEGASGMKFDFIIGNPPYQEETESDSTRMLPIYDRFMDGAYETGKKVELITPARFLFDAGQTPKSWNKKMLEDPHLSVLYFDQDASKIFPNTDIKGGIAITYHNSEALIGPIGVFVPWKELKTILDKAGAKTVESSLTDIADSSNVYDLKNIYTEKQSVRQRIGQQTHTADIQWTLAWMDNAMFKDGSGQYFTDHDFHDYLQTRRQVERTSGTEWFHVDGPTSQRMFMDFATHQQPKAQTQAEYTLREEQAEAVSMTKAYFAAGGTEFLWNAKPRFGKTLTAYDLIRKMGLRSVLIVTNRPSIANSWADDFQKFIAWRGEYDFVSETDALKNHPVVMSRDEYLRRIVMFDGEKEQTQRVCDAGSDRQHEGKEHAQAQRRACDEIGMVAFESLQGLKGSKWFGGEYDKLKWILDNTFDLLIVDESQEGVDTLRTERAFRYIKRKHTLYLSGTPFKQLASEQFSKEQIFNWSYADEQEKKDGWASDDYNPYEALPRLSMFTYQLSPMIYDTVQKGLDLPGEDDAVDFAFDLNEFFLTNESGKFIHEAEIRKFLHALTTQEKYPFSTPELRNELRHTMWYLNRVASAKALYKLLQEEEFRPIFGDYEIILAAGDGRLGEDDDKQAAAALDRVREAIRTHDKTIILTVGQLTVGITVPEWSGVLMLCNMKSPSSYMQAAFRAQNPCIFTDENGQRFRKQNAYVFDFDPARTLIIFDEFANNLRPETAAGRGTGDDREQNIKRLLNFFPVLGEDSEGKMVELDAKAVLSIPRRLKSQEVVRRGFMSNFLFQNIGNIFGAPGIVREIVEKLTPAHEEPKRRDNGLDGLDTIQVDDQGEVEIPRERVIGKAAELFGPKIYEDMGRAVQPALDAVQGGDKGEVSRQVQNVIETVKQNLREQVFTPIGDSGEIKKGTLSRIERQAFQEVDATMEKARDDYLHEVTLAEAELAQKRNEAETEIQQAEESYQNKMQDALQAFTAGMQNIVEKTIQEKPQEVVEQIEKHKEEEKKRTMEDTIRDHLRGFSRTIPSFIMAYGDENLTLANFDDYTEDDVFLEVTGISEADFRFLRDGGDAVNPETGETEHFEGHLFDEVVFNDSIQEFWYKKQALADYFDETHDEDIFDYIPPQKTNQIFTPRWVVQKMVDELEANNPGCFDDPDKTFADLYMKSGLYITEIVKRLFRSKRLKALFPDDHDRIRHIMTKQVYGMAPTRIIFLIATNYILGFDDSLKLETKNFVQADAAEAVKNGTLGKLVERHFG